MTPWLRRTSAVATVAALSAIAAGCGDDPRELVGFRADRAVVVAIDTLPDVGNDGEPFEFVAPDDGVLLVYFGYTNCPDACPATMLEAREAIEDLATDDIDVELAMVTIDPARDLGTLADYVHSYVPDAHAIGTEDTDAVRRVALAFGAEFSVDARDSGNVIVSHTDHLYAVGDGGDLMLTWQLGTKADDIAADLRQLLDAEQ